MSDRYAAYTKLKIDYPSKRILRLTFDRPETYNSVDAATHTQLTNIWRDIINAPPGTSKASIRASREINFFCQFREVVG